MKNFYRIFTVVVLLAVSAGIGLLIWVLTTNDKTVQKVELEKEGTTQSELSFTAENFLPGDVKEYTVLVHSEAGGEFGMSFTCESTGEGDLWQYLNVEICYGEVKKEVAFAELYAGTALSFDVTLEDNATAEFTVRYKMPLETGNEAQNQTADFILLLTAERK